jgi:hypothetical protein
VLCCDSEFLVRDATLVESFRLTIPVTIHLTPTMAHAAA